MNNNSATACHHYWTATHKIAFRFFFIYLSLQVLTESFLGNWFGDTLVIWRLGEKIFVPPCLWLNNHLFHFGYKPESWTTFSGSLHTIRDIVYLATACAGCFVWSMLGKNRANYNRLHYWFTQCLVTALACIVFLYGISKLFPVQMATPSLIRLHTPVGNLTPFDLIWTTLGYGKPYQVFSGFFEVTGAILLLLKRTRVAGLLIIVAVMLNVIMLNYTYQVGVLTLSFYVLLVALFLLAPHASKLLRFFLKNEVVGLSPGEYTAANNGKTKVFKIILLGLLCCSFGANILLAYNRYARAGNVDKTRQYSFIKYHIINSDTLKQIVNDTMCWHTWGERTIDGKRMLTITTMKPGQFKNYMIRQDAANHTLMLIPMGNNDTATLRFNYTDINSFRWRLAGTVKQQAVQLDLQKINPDTTELLLKTRRDIIIVNDDQGF